MDKLQTVVIVVILQIVMFVVTLVLLGMDFITGVRPAIHGFYHWILKQLGQGGLWTMRQARYRLPLAVWTLVCLGLAVVMVRSTSSLLVSVEWRMVGLIALTTGLVALIAWLIKKFVTRSPQVAKVYRRSWFRPAIVTPLIFIAIYAPIIYFAVKYEMGKHATTTTGRLSRSPLSSLPADLALLVISGCESGNGTPGTGRQSEDDGVTPLRNRKGSSAIGKYQIMASLHEAKAKGLGYLIRTLEGNERYARYLYAESGTLHWQADPDSVKCWAPKLMSLGGQPPRVIAKAVAHAQARERAIAFRSARSATTAVNNLSRQWEKRGEGDPKYCWMKTRRPRGRYSDPIQVYPTASPAETGQQAGIKKLVCVW